MGWRSQGPEGTPCCIYFPVVWRCSSSWAEDQGEQDIAPGQRLLPGVGERRLCSAGRGLQVLVRPAQVQGAALCRHYPRGLALPTLPPPRPSASLILPTGSLATSSFSRTLPGHQARRPDLRRAVPLKCRRPRCCLSTPVDGQPAHFSSTCVAEQWNEGVHSDQPLVSWKWGWLQEREATVRGDGERRGLTWRSRSRVWVGATRLDA